MIMWRGLALNRMNAVARRIMASHPEIYGDEATRDEQPPITDKSNQSDQHAAALARRERGAQAHS